MVVTWDPSHNVAYIRWREERDDVQTVTVGDEIRADMAPDGTIYGIELLNANAQLADWGGVQVLLVDDASSGRREIALPVL